MKVTIVGGGPGGLFSAALLKKTNPAHEIRVLEQNPADATYGFGVVFSDRTLEGFREADAKVHEGIMDRFARWDAIDVRYRDTTLRSHGHVFAGIERKALLELLQERCRELDVSMEFEHTFRDPSELAGQDLVIAADGVNSSIRAMHADAFGPRLDTRPWKYVWLGTTYRPEAFTFMFEQTEHGLFVGTIYPYSEGVSTLVVECDPVTWARAGLDHVTEEETVKFCHEVFSDHLAGHTIFANKSLWISFVTVRNRTWHHDNVVLIGDAAHTAHFSIGSGTKLAMEDAVALAQGFRRKANLEDALIDYERDRRPIVERVQEAARESYTWYESLDRYAGFEPIQFAFNLLVRSGRISYDNLRVRDPGFVTEMDRWFTAARNGVRRPAIAPPPLFVPFELGGRPLANRAVLALQPDGTAVDGCPADAHRDRLVAACEEGHGLVITDHLAVSAQGRITPADGGLYDERHAEKWRQILQAARSASDARIAARLGHAGRRGATRPRDRGVDRPLGRDGWELLSASAIPYGRMSRPPREMDRADMELVRDQFVEAAGRADEAGFDVLFLDFSHGYLMASFISPLTNNRSDEYGGDLESRMGYPLEVFAAVRAAWPADKPLAVSITASDWAPGGLTDDDAVQVAAVLREAGCDLIELHAGQTIPRTKPAYGRFFLAPYSDQVRNRAHVPTVVGGGIRSTDDINTLLAAGRADLCILERLEA